MQRAVGWATECVSCIHMMRCNEQRGKGINSNLQPRFSNFLPSGKV